MIGLWYLGVLFTIALLTYLTLSALETGDTDDWR